MKNLLTSIKSSFVPANDINARAARRANRKAIAELRALSDAQLKDIGIDRGSITYSVINGKPEMDTPKRAA